MKPRCYIQNCAALFEGMKLLIQMIMPDLNFLPNMLYSNEVTTPTTIPKCSRNESQWSSLSNQFPKWHLLPSSQCSPGRRKRKDKKQSLDCKIACTLRKSAQPKGLERDRKRKVRLGRGSGKRREQFSFSLHTLWRVLLTHPTREVEGKKKQCTEFLSRRTIMATLHDRNDQCVRFPPSVTQTLKSLIALLQSQTRDIQLAQQAFPREFVEKVWTRAKKKKLATQAT